jgi:hypothetical protein
MTTRERSLAFGLLGILGLLGLGFVAYQFVIGPLIEKGRQIEQREKEVAQLEGDILEIQLLKRKYEAARQQSLPADVGMSRTQYGSLLERLFRRADLASGLKIIPSEPENKSSPTVAPKKPAYTRLTYVVTAKGELYHLVDFLQHFYQQPLLHQIKTMNIQRPSDARSQQNRELDINLTIEALVLDNAPARPTLLPVLREPALLAGGAALSAYNMEAAASGRGSPVAPAEVMAEPAREYLSIPGRDIFHGPQIARKDRDTRDDDHSPFITLTSIVVNYDDGTIKAVFRDKLDDHNYTITQTAKGTIGVVGEYEVPGRGWRAVPGYSREKPGRELFFGTVEGENRRYWLVRRVTANEVILEKLDNLEKPKPQPLAFIGGGSGAVVAVPEGRIYSVSVGQNLQTEMGFEEKSVSAPTKLLTREAWRAIYAPPAGPTSAVSSDDRAGK